MAHSSVQDQLHDLDSRVSAVERSLERRSETGWLKFVKNLVVHRQEEQMARVAGWFVITASLLGIANDWVNLQSVNILFSLSLAFGLWLLARSVSFLDMSESTKTLYHQHRTKQAPAAHALHAGAHTKKPYVDQPAISFSFVRNALFIAGGAVVAIVLTWFFLGQVTDPAWQLVPFLAILLLCLGYGVNHNHKWVVYGSAVALFCLMAMASMPLYGIIALLVVAVLLTFISVTRKDWLLLGITAFFSYGSLLRWMYAFGDPGRFPHLLPIEQWMTERQFIFAGALVFVALFALPFIARRREIEDREMARFVLTVSSVGYVLTTGWLASYLGTYRWFVSLFSLVILLASFAYLSWLRYHRLSYAKYFLFLALASFLLFIYTYLDPVAVGLLWFIVSVVVLTIGFVVSSYSARWTGLAALALTVFQYIFVILPNPEQYAGPVWLHERVWLGVVLSIYLPLLALWFRDSKAKGNEARMVPVLVSTFFTTAFLFLFAIIGMESFPPVQTILWTVLGVAAAVVGVWQRVLPLRSLGLAVGVVALIKLFLVDALGFDQSVQVVTFTLFGLILIVLAWGTHRYQHQLQRYLSASK